MPSVDLVIFDCDGVLVDSEIIAAKVEAEAFTKIGYEIDWRGFASRFSGMSTLQIIQIVSDEINQPLQLDFYDAIEAQIDERLKQEVEMIAHADEMLKEFEGDCCICSNSSSQRLKITLEKTGLNHLAPPVYAAREVGDKKAKPSPSVFLYAAGVFDVEPENCIVIEDSTHGIEGARAANMRVIGFTGASHTYAGHADALIEAGAETAVSRLKDLPSVIDALESWDSSTL